MERPLTDKLRKTTASRKASPVPAKSAKSKSDPKPKAKIVVKAKAAPIARAKAAPTVKAKVAPAVKTKAAPKKHDLARVTKAAAPTKAPKSRKAEERPALLDLIVKILDDGKAEDITELNLIGKNPMTDYMVVASGRSQRHVGALAEQIATRLKKEGYGAHIEGLPACDWVLVDALDVIVHLFRPEVRTFYNLEQMWAEEPAVARAS